MSDQTSPSINRQDFLRITLQAAGVLAVGQVSFLGLRYLASRKPDSLFGGEVTAGQIIEFPPGTVTLFETARFFLVCFADGGLLALHTRCTHLACVVSWDDAAQKFLCPCHGSQFERNGTVVNPPAPRPLDRFPITFKRGRVIVDTSTRITREIISESDITYPLEG